MRFVGAELILPDRIVPGIVHVEGDRITGISPGIQQKNETESGVIDLQGGYLAPGFIDLHIHGGLGHDTMEADTVVFRKIADFHISGGTTSLALTTVSASNEEILRVLATASSLLGKALGGARILGIHLEGPYLSEKKKGAHALNSIRPPLADEWRRYLDYAPLITQMTLAPELEGACDLIKALRQNGVIASGGHSLATEKELTAALDAGMNHATHTFNCMGTAVKLGPYRIAGMLEFALAYPEIRCELIADGKHVSPTLMRMVWNAKGDDGVCLVTDAMGGAGLPIGAKYRAGSENSPMAMVEEDVAMLEDGSALAGSILTMIQAVRKTVELVNVPLHTAVKAASLNPAEQLGKDNELGSIEIGKKADLVWFDKQFNVRGVWIDGEMKYHNRNI
ncbi:MAG: N-acetylglucosamine-6-phosphate deacetylase [Verrucomicrobia bacterium]|nr:N-acetylglucosamine-6-phosphate deacetylase [Verrucomicrobiota bacterium]MCF7708009.1 N-acetylglucosamine-6-phosphate deacetylase [Verrucomicrobiota bacterium]